MNRYESIIRQINEIQAALSEISNDELRHRISIIRKSIKSSIDEESILNAMLPEVYACVKETERRFSMSPVKVTANKFDEALSKEYDFVKVKDGTAVYDNEWFVQGYKNKWVMVPYDEQLLGAVYLHDATAIEMATGEGKTLVATLPAFLNALTGKGVHIITTNAYLSLRDFEQMRPIYLFHGITVGCIENNERYGKQHKMAYCCDITFGASSTFIFDYLFDNMALTKEGKCQQRTETPYHYAVIDELDSILIDEANTPHIIAGGDRYNEEQLYKKLKPVIEELIKDDTLFTSDRVEHKASFTEKGRQWLEGKCGKGIFKYQRLYEAAGFDQLPPDEQKVIMTNQRKQNALTQLLCAYTVYTLDVDYVIDEKERIVIIDQNTGRPKPQNRWEHGLHTAIEVKENQRVNDEYEGLGVISVKNFYRQYCKLSGMSGTITQVSEELKDQYGLNTRSVPTHKPCRRVDHPLHVSKNKQEKEREIIELIRQIHHTGRPILVGCPSVKANERICTLLKDAGVPFEQLNAKSQRYEAKIIAAAGKEGAVTVSTSIAGRGTDIKLSQQAKQSGGLYVIGTSLFDSYRVDRQLMGRAGRQGDDGDSQFFTSFEDDILHNVKYDSKTLRSEEDVIKLFKEAQQQKDREFFKQRMEVSKKDDTVEPFRKKFYAERNFVLEGKENVNALIERVTNMSSSDKAVAYEHIKKFYKQVKPYVQRIVENESSDVGVETTVFSNGICELIHQTVVDKRYFDIPFSDRSYMYVVTVDKKKFIDSYEYFQEEFLRQNVLMVYDKCWTRFVNYVMENLDEREIEHLPQYYEKVYDEIGGILQSRVLNSVVPITENMDAREGVSSHTVPVDRQQPPVKADDPCPCGSGKKYCECHGRSTRNKIKVRR